MFMYSSVFYRHRLFGLATNERKSGLLGREHQFRGAAMQASQRRYTSPHSTLDPSLHDAWTKMRLKEIITCMMLAVCLLI